LIREKNGVHVPWRMPDALGDDPQLFFVELVSGVYKETVCRGEQ